MKPRLMMILAVFVTLPLLAIGMAQAASAASGPSGNARSNCLVPPASTYGEPTIAGLHRVDALLGTTVTCLETFNNPMPNWAAWEAPWAFTNGQPAGTVSYNHWLREGHSVILGQDLVPQSVGGGWEAACAAGHYNPEARQFARNLASYGAGGITIRLGIEANGSWEADYVGSHPGQWAACFRQEVSSMKSVAPHLVIAWNPNACYSSPVNGRNLSAAPAWYPGNAYVNVVAADDYDTDCHNGKTVAQEGWTAFAAASQSGGPSLKSLRSFAEAHGKPFAVAEWSVTGDDAAFVNGLSGFLKGATPGWSFQTYFDNGHDGIPQLSAHLPKTVHAYKAQFG